MSIFSPLLFLPIESDSDMGLFALRPLFIAGMIQPVVDGDGGINIAVVSDYPDGVLCVIDPYVGMQVGDQHDIYWGTLNIWHKEVLPEELDKRLFFYLPIALILPGWVETVHYQLTHKGSTIPDDSSVPLRVLVKLDKPGGHDKEPHKPGHSELKPVGLPEDVIQNGVTTEWAEKGVPLTVRVYPGIRVRDVIFVYWGSVRLPPHVVTLAQADGTDPIIIVADQAAILAGGDSAALLLEYGVRDEVWNWSEKRSLSTTVLVDAGAWRLEQPIIKESVNGAIDLIKLGKDDVTVQIHVRTDDFDIGDTLVMTWIGTPFHGEPLIHRSKPVPIDNIPSILELMVPNAAVRAIAMGKADASYVLTKKNGGPPMSSKRTFANVVGEVSQLPAPTIREVIGDTLEPVQSKATVDIGPSDLIKGGDLIDLVWLGTKSNGQPYPHEVPHVVSEGEVGKTITLYVEAEHIKVLENGKLKLFYRVSNDKSALYGVSESEHTFYDVEAVRAELPAPKVVEAPDDFLDPAWVPGAATLRIGYLGTAAGDVLTYYWRGATAAGSTSDWVPITTIIAGKPVDFRIDKQFFTPNLNQQVEVRYTLLRAATGKHSYSAALKLYVGKEVKPSIDKVTDSQLRDIANDGTTVDTTVILTGKATPNLKVVITDNGVLPQTVDVGPDGIWTSTRTGLTLTAHNFVAKAAYGAGLESPVWGVKVVAEVQPSIDKVTDSQLRDITNGGTTIDTTVILTGRATANLQVEVRVTGLAPKPVRVAANGNWTLTLADLPLAVYSVVAKALYGNGKESNTWKFTVVKEELARPEVIEADANDVLDPARVTLGASMEIAPYDDMAAGDEVFIKWTSPGNTLPHEADVRISANQVGKIVKFTIPYEVVRAALNHDATLRYEVVRFVGGRSPSKPLVLQVRTQSLTLPDPRIEQAKGKQLNPDDVFPGGATVLIGVTAQLKEGDLVTVQWRGKRTTHYPRPVLSSDEGKELRITVPHAVVDESNRTSIGLSYTVQRKIGGTDPSLEVPYDVLRIIDTGTLRVMGARYNRTTYRASSVPRMLSALSLADQALNVEWQYSTDTVWKAARTWRDTAPWKPLRVRSATHSITLNPANIFGSGADTNVSGQAAFVALRDMADVVGWGSAAYGASIPQAIGNLTDIEEVSCTRSAYAVRRRGGQVQVWGTAGEGGNMGSVSPQSFTQVIGSSQAFAGIKADGQVVAWGDAASGASVPTAIGSYRDVAAIYSAGQAFAAQRASGEVVAWGLAANGGSMPGAIGSLRDIVDVAGSYGAFAALRSTRQLVAWGHATYGGTLPSPISTRMDIAQLGAANAQAFTALSVTGQVVAWGTANYGGTVPANIGGLTGLVEVSSTWRAFAARHSSGSVYAWGFASEGGTAPTITDAVQVVGSSQAFAALRRDGTVVAWGDPAVGGSTAAVVGQLINVQALYSNSHGFTALTSDGRVVTWGHAGGGGNSGGVQDKLQGNVNHQARGAQSIDTLADDLRAPTVDEAPGDVLDPETLPAAGATVRIKPYDNMVYRDYVYLTVGSYTDNIPISQSAVGRDVEFKVSRAEFLPHVGKRVPVRYEVQRYLGGRDRSLTLELEVQLGFENALTFDLGSMNYVVANKPPVQLPAFVRMTREATWGTAPYRFSSSDERIATVSNNGEVTAIANGNCTISATDSSNETRRYELTIKGIVQLHFLSPGSDWQGMKNVCAAASLEPVTLTQIKRLWELYFPGSGGVGDYLELLHYPFWTGDLLGAGTAWAYDLHGTSMNENAESHTTDVLLQVFGASRTWAGLVEVSQ
jgi:hypothetical protein